MSKTSIKARNGAKAVAALPATIRVHGFDITIERVSALDAEARGIAGEFSGLHEAIRICETLPSPARAVEVFLHELMHALWWVDNLDDATPLTEEHAVSHLANGLMQVHRDNPWLAPWIAGNTR